MKSLRNLWFDLWAPLALVALLAVALGLAPRPLLAQLPVESEQDLSYFPDRPGSAGSPLPDSGS